MASPQRNLSTGSRDDAAEAFINPPHPEAQEIIRQVEYYFSDDNLPHDAHLLGMAGGDPNGPVSLSEILSWRKMKRFRPMSAVREALKQSQLVEVVDSKHIRRKIPLTKQITTVPQINETRRTRYELQVKAPWLSKGMLKKTGLETNAIDGPISPEEYAVERKAFDPEDGIATRLENAVNRFSNRRKMHQSLRAVFEKFMIFGGMDAGRQFVGGMDKKQLKKQGFDAEEIERLTANYSVSEKVIDGLEEEQEGGPFWVVDFTELAKAFLSSQFMNDFDWYEASQVTTATNVLRNFYNYLLLHDVCPEFEDQIKVARNVCDLAEEELLKLAVVDRCLPGDFNVACSTLHGGSYAGIHRDTTSGADWMRSGTNIGLDEKTAKFIFKAGIAAYGNKIPYHNAYAATQQGSRLEVVYEEKLGLEVVWIEHAPHDLKAFHSRPELNNAATEAVGKLHCVRWEVPFAPEEDLPPCVLENNKNIKSFEFLVEESTLKTCFPGMKLEAVVKTLDIGITWIDAVEATYPSFFTWLPNERIRDWREPGEPKEWMNRRTGVGDQMTEYERDENGD